MFLCLHVKTQFGQNVQLVDIERLHYWMVYPLRATCISLRRDGLTSSRAAIISTSFISTSETLGHFLQNSSYYKVGFDHSENLGLSLRLRL